MTPPAPRLSQLAAAPLDEADVETLHRVAALYAIADPVPAGLTDRLKFGITLDALHAEVAELQRTGGLAGARGDDTTEVQTITFSSSTLTTMVTITASSPERVRVDGWVAPGAGVGVELRTQDGSIETTADEDGRFSFADVPRGLAQFVLRPPSAGGRAAVITPSLQL